MQFNSKKPHFEYLKKKWTKRHRSLQEKLFDKHLELRQMAVGGLGGLMLLASPATALLPAPHLLASGAQISKDTDNNLLLANDLEPLLPTDVRSLSSDEEAKLTEVLNKHFDFKVAAAIDGKRLNRSYGVIGGEQHLYRFPGDNLFKHADSAADVAMYIPAGIAPGLGAWGYFAPSESQFTPKDALRERYYIAVQTFLSAGFAERTAEYRDFFKFRKMLLVNPKTGQAVVTVIGDAGPAEWTGKHLGGSPEVMHFLGLAGGPRKGPVLYFFIDDPNDTVPLGPIKLKNYES